MNDNDLLINDILDYFVMNKHDHCVALDHGLTCDDIDGDSNDCIGCWLYYFKKGEWWGEEPEQDMFDLARARRERDD